MVMTVSSFLKFMPLIVSLVCYGIAMSSHGGEAGGRKGNTRRWNRPVYDTGLPVAPFRTVARNWNVFFPYEHLHLLRRRHALNNLRRRNWIKHMLNYAIPSATSRWQWRNIHFYQKLFHKSS